MTAQSFKKHLIENIFPFWNNLRDNEFGGFYGFVDHHGKIDKKSDKGVILNDRILWFYSSAYSLLKDETLLSMAEHAYRFFKEACLDKECGGVFWALSFDGKIVDDTKHTYNQAFAIYALSMYYEASGDREALETAYKLYDLIETKCRDEHGYLEAFNRNFMPTSNEKLSENGVMADRTMNTLLHVFEAYTELYNADHSPRVQDSLIQALKIFTEEMYNPGKKRLEVFFNTEYDSLIDLHSYGHDIEASWLIDRGLQILKIPSDLIHSMTDAFAETVYSEGYDPSHHALNNESECGRVDRQKIWWVQAEAVIGFYNAFQKHPENTRYKEASANIWNYILNNMIDPRTGEWYESITAEDKVNESQGLVHAWKCPYHTGRMCIEMIRRLSGQV